jgi:hypothetical protein
MGCVAFRFVDMQGKDPRAWNSFVELIILLLLLNPMPSVNERFQGWQLRHVPFQRNH